MALKIDVKGSMLRAAMDDVVREERTCAVADALALLLRGAFPDRVGDDLERRLADYDEAALADMIRRAGTAESLEEVFGPT